MGLLSSDKNDSKVQETERVAADAAAAIADEKAKTGKKRAQSYWAVSWNIFKKNMSTGNNTCQNQFRNISLSHNHLTYII